MFILDKDSGESKSIEINKLKTKKMKILTVAFMHSFNSETKCLPDTFVTWAGRGEWGASYCHHAQHLK